MDAPLNAIRRIILESNGLITIAFRRTLIINGIIKPSTDIPNQISQSIDGNWFTSSWTQIEAAMAFQIGLPILIIREKGVFEEGILEKGIVGIYVPKFNLEKEIDEYFNSTEWNDIIGKWEGYVRTVANNKGNPPKLY